MRTPTYRTPISKYLCLTAAAGLLLASALSAAPPRPEEVSNPHITAPEIVAHVKYLASEELQGRGSGTAGNDLAAEYLADRFRAVGLKPAGEHGSYFQQFPVISGLDLGPETACTLRSGSRSHRLRPASVRAAANGEADGDYMPLSFSANAGTYAPVVFAGYGISKPELGYDDYQGLDVRGKIVLVLRHTPDMNNDGQFGPYARLTYKTRTAREKGAAGILLVTGPLGDHEENLGWFRMESASADCGIPAAIVKRGFAEKLLEPTGKTLRDLQVMIAHGKTQSFLIPGARAGLRVKVVRETRPTRNVLGFLEGADPKLKKEVVVIGAHYDHLGLGSAHSLEHSQEPAIHHGADDNASGTAGILELAHHFAANREKLGRSLLFVGFSGEEIGLLGSAHWTKQPTIPLERIAAMINLDMIGRMQGDSFMVIGAGSSPAWKPILDEASRKHGLQARTAGGPRFGGSDHQPFYAKGIPVLFFFTGIHADYHKPSDTWEKVNAEGQAKLLAFIADTAEKISRLPARPLFVRSPDEEQSPGPGFRVFLGTIPDYAEQVEGVAFQGVREGSPAEKAGIRAGDVLVEFDGKQVRNVDEFTDILSDARPNVPVRVVVLRSKQRVTLTVVPAPRRN